VLSGQDYRDAGLYFFSSLDASKPFNTGMDKIEDDEFGTMSYGKIGWLSFGANCRSGAVRTDAPKFIHSVDYSATMPKACLIRGSERYANIHTAVAIRSKWQTIDGTTGIIRSPDRRPCPREVSIENPPAAPIPAIATEAASPESPPVISLTATTKKSNEPTARNAAAQNVSTARIFTPPGRFTALTFSHVPALYSRVTPLLRLPGKRCDRSALSSKETPCLVVIGMTVAPIPVLVLMFVALFLVHAIMLVPFCQISSVRMIFAVVPVMVVMVARVVDSNLNAGFLRCCSQNGSAGRKGGCQNQCAYESMCVVHIE